MTHSIEPRLLTLGDSALAVELGTTVDPEINARILALDAAIMASPPVGLIECVPTYRSLLLHLDPLKADIEAIGIDVRRLASTIAPKATASRRWKVPVVYGGDFGIDLEATAAHHKITPETLISRHSAPVYRVYMLGFMPGYSYLGGLDPALATPRREVPRMVTPAGTISIGGVQAAIASVEAPSGWHLLGRTPVRTFMPERAQAFFIQPGDEVVFTQVPPAAWDALDARAAAGDLVAEIVAP